MRVASGNICHDVRASEVSDTRKAGRCSEASSVSAEDRPVEILTLVQF
jgi:hypothetical protein